MTYYSATIFLEKIYTLISKGNIDGALRHIQDIVEQIFFEPLNVTKIPGARQLDALCQEIGARHWHKLLDEGKCAPTGDDDANVFGNATVFIASKLYASGGHTLALADIARLTPKGRKTILITGVVGTTDAVAIRQRFDAIPDVSIEYAPHCGQSRKLDWLQRRIMALAPHSVWLFNHHQDSVAIAAVQPDAGYRVHFYHHGDHHLCLGVYLDYVDHIDMHPMGFHSCREELSLKCNRYLPLVVRDHGDRRLPSIKLRAPGLVSCTAASAIKVETPYWPRYTHVVPTLLRATRGRHIHIGPLSWIALFLIRQGMRKMGLPRSAFVHIPFVPSVWDALQEHGVNLYIASFPYGGARTLIEAMGAGIAVVLHAHHSSRLLSTFDMAYEGAFCWRTPDELCEYVAQLDAGELDRQGQAARRHYEKYYREESLAAALADPNHAIVPQPLRLDYAADDFQQALDVSTQVSLPHLVQRRLRRLAARLKSVIGRRLDC